MSYGAAAALQTAVYQLLVADTALSALVGTAIFDAVPTGTAPSVYVILGPEKVAAQNDGTGHGARHRFTVSVVSDDAGFLTSKSVAAAVSDALDGAAPALARGRIVRMQFRRANAERVDTATKRRIDLSFEAWVDVD